MNWRLKWSGICGVAVIALSAITIIMAMFVVADVAGLVESKIDSGGRDYLNNPLEVDGVTHLMSFLPYIMIISGILSLGFLLGFVVLGNRLDNNLLKYSSWILIFVAVLAVLANIFTLFVDSAPIPPSENFLVNAVSSANPLLGSMLGIIPESIIFIFSILILVIALGILVTF